MGDWITTGALGEGEVVPPLHSGADHARCCCPIRSGYRDPH
jgi:hypothetical protein